MTISVGKMRMPIAKISRKASKGLKMKNMSTKKKKLNAAKALDDSISETISFVIKGHLTPFKATVVAKKTNAGKKNLKLLAKNTPVESSTKKTQHSKKIREDRESDSPKSPKIKIAKKPERKAGPNIKVKKVNTKTLKPASTTRKASKKSLLNAINSLVSPETLKSDIGKSLLVNHAANKVKNEISEKLPKKNTKEPKQVTKVKTETLETKKQIKNATVKRRKSPSKAETIEKDKQIKEKKLEVTGKKIKKSEELKMKSKVSNSPQQDKNALMKQKPATGKQSVKDKPKKNRVSSPEHKSVNEDVKVVTSKTPKSNSIKEGVNSIKTELPVKQVRQRRKNQAKRKKIKSEDSSLSTDDTSSTSDEITLDVLRQHHSEERKIKSEPTLKHTEETSATSKKVTGKAGQGTDTERKSTSQKPAAVKQKLGKKIQKKPTGVKSKAVVIKKEALTTGKNKAKRKEDQKSRKMKLFGFWNGPKRHRVASLNALAKVHCLYENETRGALLDTDSIKSESNADRRSDSKDDEVLPTRTLRSAPGLRGAGKHWDMHDETFSSSEENESSAESSESIPKNQKIENDKKPVKKRPYTKRRRNRCELIMDLKDMVVRKRMASLNASAILAASYSVEKRTAKSPKSEETDSEDSEESFTRDSDNKKKCYEEDVKKEEDRKLIEVRATPNKKVSVILNQDTDVTITGVYVNSTTRSTHHEGYCSIAGMQYRISAKSHTQTASTTVASETIMQSAANIGENSNVETPPHPCKSYTPLSALSSMQPPGAQGQSGVPLAPPQHMSSQHVIPLSASQHIPHTSPIGRRHGCTSAFSAPPSGPYGPPPPAHHHPPPPPPSDPGYIHGYYQPAGPLINVPPHGHPQPSSLGKPAPLSEISSSPTPPPSHQPHSQSSAAESMDSDVIITSATSAKEPLQPQQPPPAYRYSQYPAPHPGYSYGYPPQYYPAPPPAPSYHHELCYPPNPYLHHKAYPPPTYRRHLAAPAGTQYYQANPPDLYHPPPSAPNQQSQQVVTANPAVSSAYQPPPSGPPPPLMDGYPPPTLVEPYPPPHYYPGYGPAPPPSCYSHSPARTLPYINAAYQSCPCPMQSCPKNVHTGPLTGDSKRSNHISSIAKDSLPLPPVALALPLEPVSATGPPSPARGSAGMPPPPSPAGATYQPPPPAPKQEGTESSECKPIEKRRKARIGKNMVRNNIAANFPENTMLLMCHAPQQNMCVTNVKREIESPQEQKPCSDEIIKSKTEVVEVAPLRNSSSIENIDNSSSAKVQNERVVNCLKTEEQVEHITPTKVSETEAIEKTPEELLPCQKTVAENVKVKNMKRKLSITRDLEKVEAETPPPQKKQKVDNSKVNGSYKDLIKKHVPSYRINNGKRKLNIESDKPIIYKNSKLKLKRTPLKRKLSPSKEETNNKRLKVSKPLTASNLHNSKQNVKTNKGKCFVDCELSENKEPLKTSKRLQVNSKNNINKKLAPAILDNLFAKNNVDRTIECVVNGYSEGLRTTKKSDISANKTQEKCKNLKVDNKQESTSSKSTNSKSGPAKSKVVVAKKVGASKRKTKSKSIDIPPATVTKVLRRHVQVPKWSNGWTWKGEPFQSKVFLNSDETVVARKCYPAMRHAEGDVIEPRDCVLLKAGPRKNDLPFVAKVAALWENPEDGEMMMSLLWYYRPEHTEQGRQPYDEPDEVFASRHKDTNSVACIEDKCYVLTFNEYCRYRKTLKRIEEGLEDTGTCIPNPEPYPRLLRQPPSTPQTPPELVFFCRRVYDFRQKRIVKNPS